MTQPLEFIDLLYGNGISKPHGWFEFRCLPSKKSLWMPYPTFAEHPDAVTLDNLPIDTQQVYLGVSAQREQRHAGTDAGAIASHLTWVDIDLDGTPYVDGLTKDELLQLSAEEMRAYARAALDSHLKRFGDAGLPPRAVVYSGHGLQVYWAADMRFTDDDAGKAEQRQINKGLAAAFDGDPVSVNPSRILRLPGSYNRKNPERPLLCELWYGDTDATVSREALAAYAVQPEPVARAEALPRQERPSDDRQRAYALSALRREADEVAAAPEGGRNHRLNEAAFKAGTLVGAGQLDEAECVAELQNAAERAGLGEDEITDTIRSGLNAGKAKPRDLTQVRWEAPQSAGRGTIRAQPEGVGLTAAEEKKGKKGEDGPSLAEYRDMVLASFMERGLIYRHHQIWRNWWRYEGGVYIEIPDEVMAQTVDLTLQAQGYTLKNAQITEILVKIGRDPAVGSREVDQTAWELNTRDGVLDLASGELLPHTPEYFSTIQSAAHYRPDAVAHDWLAFLSEAVPSSEDREMLQMFAGLCLTGDTSPQRALLLVGDGGTGKSTFVRVLQAVLGNLSTSSALENIKDGSFLVGTLVGKRMCVVSELQRNVDWLPFKRVTGEDMISVDVKNKTPYTTKLDMKLIILSNVMPHLGDDTSNNSLMRRFLPVAFNVRPAVPDPTLEQRLTAEAELPGVLNWMLEGLRMLEGKGMRFPAGDQSALAREIVEDSNLVISFLRERCAYQESAETPATELFEAYRDWSGQNGYRALSSKRFATQLQAAGRYFGKALGRERKRTGTVYQGVKLTTLPGGWEEEE